MISIIIPVWGKSHLTEAFLMQHSMFTYLADYEMVIVNNGSTDNTKHVLDDWARKSDFLRVIHSLENLGFGGGNNLGVKESAGDVLIFTQNDVRVHGDYVAALSKAVVDLPTALHGASLYEFDTGWNKFGGEIAPYVEGWCMACTREAFLEVGMFDERYYPCDFEDVDLSQSFLRRGMTLNKVNVPLSHIGHGTAGLSASRERITHRHRTMFAKKWGFAE